MWTVHVVVFPYQTWTVTVEYHWILPYYGSSYLLWHFTSHQLCLVYHWMHHHHTYVSCDCVKTLPYTCLCWWSQPGPFPCVDCVFNQGTDMYLPFAIAQFLPLGNHKLYMFAWAGVLLLTLQCLFGASRVKSSRQPPSSKTSQLHHKSQVFLHQLHGVSNNFWLYWMPFDHCSLFQSLLSY